MKKFICDGEKYKYGEGYIYMPIEIGNLPESISVEGYSLHVKSKFHCSLVCIKIILPVYGNDIEEKIIKYFCDFISKNDISFLKYKNKFRLVKKGEKVSVIVMCDVSNLESFFQSLEKKHNIKMELPPAHVTIYTLQPNIGIGIRSQTELSNLSTSINVPDDVKRALMLTLSN